MAGLCKKKGTCCVAFGCNMRSGTNLRSLVRMFCFPKDPVRRELWKNAVQRENWNPTSSSRLCNLHFVKGKPSSEPTHPDYVPSIFNHKKQDSSMSSQVQVDRYERLAKRLKIESVTKKEDDSISTIQEISIPQHNKEVSVMTDITMAYIADLESKNKAFQLQSNLKENNSASAEVLASKKMFSFYTKLPNLSFFHSLLAYLLSCWKPQTATDLEPHEQLLLVFMKLRLGLLNEDLAYRFHIGIGTASAIFREWISRMDFTLHRFIYWPSKKTLRSNLPKCFANMHLQNVTCVMDCSEIFLDRPFNLDARAQSYSNYKHHNTVKFLITVSPTGCIMFISQLYGGRISDKELTKLSGVLDNVKKNDVVLADRGFSIEELVALRGAKVIKPASTYKKQQLSGQDVTISRVIAKARVHVERKIGRLKSYRILKSTWPVSLINTTDDGNRSTGDKILTVLSALCNISKAALLKT